MFADDNASRELFVFEEILSISEIGKQNFLPKFDSSQIPSRTSSSDSLVESPVCLALGVRGLALELWLIKRMEQIENQVQESNCTDNCHFWVFLNGATPAD